MNQVNLVHRVHNDFVELLSMILMIGKNIDDQFLMIPMFPRILSACIDGLLSLIIMLCNMEN
jgi:hypothetical protein